MVGCGAKGTCRRPIRRLTALHIRRFVEDDADAVVGLSIRAWTPVFASMRATLGDALFLRFWPSWEHDQEKAVRDALAAHETWVSTEDDVVTGFVNVAFDGDERSADIHMIAVDPAFQGSGHARALTDFATDEMQRRGITLATVSTGGDPGHGPARATYEAAGFTSFPQVLYAKILEPESDDRPQ